MEYADTEPTRDLDQTLSMGPVLPTGLETDPWAWAHAEQSEPTRPDTSAAYVTAVLVTFDAARWLPDTLAALARLQGRPQRLIAIDNGSADETRELLERARDTGVLDAVYEGQRTFGFGAAVNSALRKDRATAAERTPHSSPTTHPRQLSVDDADEHHWLWLLHDDAEPAPDCLQLLLGHVLTSGSIDITGPKLVLPQPRYGGQPLSEVGVSISATGRRELAVDLGEIDQGQQDQPHERLGVSTCGMLVRAAVWQDLDGLDPALPVFRDGVEFGWRAHLNGYRVVTTPAAVIVHRQAGRAGLRPRGLTGRRPGAVDRRLGMLVVVGHAPGRMLGWVWLRLTLSCLLHALGYLLGKVPGRALDELIALDDFVRHPRRIRELRSRTAGIDPEPGTGEIVQALRPSGGSGLRLAAESISGALTDRYRSAAGELDAATLDELTGDEFSSAADERPRYPWLNPIVLVITGALVASLVAARSLLGLGSLAGPALLPAPDSLRAAWHAALAPIPGAPGMIAPPWLSLYALGSTVLAGRPAWFTGLLVCGVVPLALATVYPVLRQLVRDRRVRICAAVSYALLPVLLGGTNQGRLVLSVYAVCLPLLVLAARALVLRRVRTPEAWRGGWGAGVVLVVLAAFQPAILIPATLLGALGAVQLRRTPRKIGRIGIALGLPLLIFTPWIPSLILAPGRLFTGPDAALDGAGSAPAVWRLLLGTGLGPGLPPLWISAVIFGVVWLVALIGLGRRGELRLLQASWITALVAFAMAVCLSRLVVDVPPAGAEVRPYVGAFVLVAFAALILAGAAGVDGMSAQMATRSFGWLQPMTVLSGVLVALVTVGGAAWWVVAGASGPIERTRLDAVPPYVLNAMATPGRPRVLAIDLASGEARYSVLADGQVRLGAAERGLAFGGSAAAWAGVDDLVVRLVAGTADAEIPRQLGDLGIGYVWLSGADENVTSRMGNTPGLGPASGTEGTTVWTLEPAVSRAVLASGDQTSPVTGSGTGVLPPGSDNRVFRIGEAADPRWRATIGEQRLAAVDAGWQQAFAVPAAGGTVQWELRSIAPWLVLGQGLVLLVAIVLAAPGIRRPEVRDPTRSARRAAAGADPW